MDRRPFNISHLRKGLRKLYKQGFLKSSEEGWAYTQAGKRKGQRVTKLHRLWELYLTEYLRIAPDHVHEDAETIEHIITPELEKKLEEKLRYPKLDPHQSEIPYRHL
jgi:manganese/zinc/iron transport system permease protein